LGQRDKYDQFYRGLVTRLIEKRKALGLTQVEVAKILKTDQSRISKFERLERRIDLVDYIRFCKAIDLDPPTALKAAMRDLG
jgi:transcriptional regulator with XRE-family HTH domain